MRRRLVFLLTGVFLVAAPVFAQSTCNCASLVTVHYNCIVGSCRENTYRDICYGPHVSCLQCSFPGDYITCCDRIVGTGAYIGLCPGIVAPVGWRRQPNMREIDALVWAAIGIYVPTCQGFYVRVVDKQTT